MPSLNQMQKKRHEMRESILQQHRDGSLRSGEALPPVRELAKQYELSVWMAASVLREMGDEGLVQLKRGAGVYMGLLPEHAGSNFVTFSSEELTHMPHTAMTCEGFEREIARRSGTSMTLTPATNGLNSVLKDIGKSQLEIAGALYLPSYEVNKHERAEEIVRALGDIPLVLHDIEPYAHLKGLKGLTYDTIRFDDFEGGRQAVRHLWKRGHRQLAFLGLHAKVLEETEFLWSLRREAGYRSALEELGGTFRSFCPAAEASPSHATPSQELAGQEAAEKLMPLIRSGEVDAIVCVNHTAIKGFMRVVRQSYLTESQMPTVIAFDDLSKGVHLLSVLRVSYDDLGRYAAVALWERTFGTQAQRNAPPREILVPMRLIARPSSTENYPTMAVADPIYAGL